MVEQEAVNFEVAGSSPASRAKLRIDLFGSVFSLSQEPNLEPDSSERNRFAIPPPTCWQTGGLYPSIPISGAK